MGGRVQKRPLPRQGSSCGYRGVDGPCVSGLSHGSQTAIDKRSGLWFGVRPLTGEAMNYAVIETGGKQYRVSAGDTLEIERLPVEAGQSTTFDRVLFVNQEGRILVGTPTVANAAVVAEVVAHKRGEKKIIWKMKRRKGYHKLQGHRQELTVVKIKDIKV